MNSKITIPDHKPTSKSPKFTKPISQPTFLLLLSLLSLPISLSSQPRRPPPIPILPIPTSAQLQWQLSETALFLHFGPNTFTDSEWGTGSADPAVFRPAALSATQWISVAKESGFSRVILTAKHHDGFCLWPSQYTNYSVRASPWRNGNGDVVGELAAAAEISGVQLGVYLSPWDRHEPCYGKTQEYNEHYMGQMTELLTRYGVIREVWLDGAKGEGEKDMEYFFNNWFSLIRQLQPQAVIFSDAGPDVRWVGDEGGFAATTSWSIFNRSAVKIGDTDPKYSQEGDPFGQDWVPAECDVSIRPGWFWHASESPKSAQTLLDIYYKSVGRNCLLLLNVPPNSSGLISDEDIQVLQEFNKLRKSIFSHNLATSSAVWASSTRQGIVDSQFESVNVLEEGIYSYWAPEKNQSDWALYLDFENQVTFNVLQVQEPIQMGQRVFEFHLDALNEEGQWDVVINGTTLGYKRILRFPTVVSDRLRFVIEKSREDPLISYLAIHMDSVSSLIVYNTSSTSYFNGSQVIRQSVYNHSQIVSM
ncbi:Alpha-L-fucosidase [Actinidia chinensis var. chinensis]|uniref:alpha-L-fucosidase n=1 Tax=Actinidia chinensis var. chinensis TaxID=1590841 RepID=A0A2R6P7D7_ACTCC|nr:Alpha-L-fucosidase [Actinidia chinensis var. chinensis]